MLDGAARLDELVATAVADGQPAIGITDHGNMYGTLEFYKECRNRGIKPIIGTEAYMAHDSRYERPTRRGRLDDSGGDTEAGQKLYYHLTLLAENQTGYRNLIQLSSLAFLEGYYYKPRIDWELLEKYSDGLIATTGCLGGHVLQSLLRGDESGAVEKAARLQDISAKTISLSNCKITVLQIKSAQTLNSSTSENESVLRCSPQMILTTRIVKIMRLTTPCCVCKPVR